MSDYLLFSKYYDFIAGGSQDIFVPFILDSINAYKPESKSILELGSGTGNNLIALSKKFETYGLELSPEMLAISKKKDKKSVYSQGDMSDFDLGQKFDVIICMFDSINHLPSLNHWKKTFDCSHRHLVDGGLFIFDFNTIFDLSSKAERYPTYVSCGDDFVLIENSFKRNSGTWHFKIFNKDKSLKAGYLLSAEDITERSYELDKIKSKLGSFKILKFVDADGKKPTSETTRVFVVCRK